MSKNVFSIYFLLVQPILLSVFLGSISRGGNYVQQKDQCLLGYVYRDDSCLVLTKEFGYPIVNKLEYQEIFVDKNNQEFLTNRKYIEYETPLGYAQYQTSNITRPITYNDLIIIFTHFCIYFVIRKNKFFKD